ncbi:insulinase family protein [bacterium]|nr:insulinase family protein [bacterium]
MHLLTSLSSGDITRFAFDNGLVAITRPNPFVPVIAMRGSFRGGASLESDDDAGLTKLVAMLLKSGTESQTAIQIAEGLDYLGSSITFTANHDSVNFSLTSLSKHFDRSLAILADLLIRSVFPADEIERARRLALADIKQKADQPMQIAWDVCAESVFQNHPYRRTIDGSATTINKLTREDIIKAYHNIAVSNRLTLAIVGDFEPQSLIQKLIDQFSSITTDHRSMSPLEEPVVNSKRKILLVERDLKQANICFGNIACKRNIPDYYSTVLMNYILGGSGLTSRLTHRIRTQQGLAYSVYSQLIRRAASGIFTVRMQTKTDNTGKAIESILDEIKRMQNETVLEPELSDAKKFFAGSFPFRIQTNHDYAYYLEQGEFFHLPLNYLNDEVTMIQKVDQGDIKDAAQKYLNTNHYILAIVSKTESLKTPMETFGVVEEVQVQF